MNSRILHIFLILPILFLSCKDEERKEKYWAYLKDDIPLGFEFERLDSILIPNSVYAVYERLLDSVYKDVELPEELNRTIDDFIIKYFFAIPVDKDLFIFVMHFTDQSLNRNNAFTFVAYNSRTKRYSLDPFSSNAYYSSDNEMSFTPSYRLMSRPYFRIDKEKKILVMKERRHNGNVYNAVEEHWVKIDDNMELSLLFSIETLAFIPFDETTNKIHRELDDNHQLHVTLIDSTNKIISDIGKASLIQNSAGAFEWKDVQISDTLYKKLFFTCEF